MKDKIYLNSEYNYEVKVQAVENRYYPGILKISQQQIQLEISGEVSKDNDYFQYNDKIQLLECHSFKLGFKLYNLNCIFQSSAILDPNLPGTNPRAHCKIKYEIEYVEIYEYGLSIKKYNNISIYSDDIAKWVGNTENQQKLLYSNNNTAEDHIDVMNHLIEDSINIGSNINFAILYNYEKFTNLEKKSAGVIFEPFICIDFSSEKDISEVRIILDQTITFLSFIFGYNIDIKYIEGTSFNYNITGSKSNIFYNIASKSKLNHQTIMFPYGKKQVFQTIELPNFEMNFLKNYYSLSTYELSFYKSFLKYKNYDFSEEKLLGYYRILEQITYTEKPYFDQETIDKICVDFKKILQDNDIYNKNSRNFMKICKKMSTNKNSSITGIIKFFKEIPSVIREQLNFDIETLNEINSIRNDITHFNEYYLHEHKLQKYCFILDFICTLSLLKKVGYSTNNFETIFKRHIYYDHLIKCED